jgi:1-acyl-sn-glycerol-3-phosphate acyltransferase
MAAPVRPGRTSLPGPNIGPLRRTARYWISRIAVAGLCRAYLRFRVEGRDRLPGGPAIYCFNHLNWTDPFVLMTVLPFRPRLWFFGPKEEDMARGGRNRIMAWTGSAIPYKPAKNDLLDATRHVGAVIATGAVVAIAAEGRIHASESELLPLSEGAAYFALRSGIPLVPIAINGTSWLRFGGRVRVRVGEPLRLDGRPTREAVSAATAELSSRLQALVADAPDMPLPGRFGRWLTEQFNDWPEGSRAAALAASEVAGLAYFDPSQSTQEAAWQPPGSRPIQRNTAAASPSRPTSRSTPGSRS